MTWRGWESFAPPTGPLPTAGNMAKSGNKYHAQRTTVDGIAFASKRESRRYLELKALLAAGKITNLKLQPSWRLEVNGVLIGTFTGDFEYDTADGEYIVEDAKSPATRRARDYPLRKKLMKALHDIEVVEV